MPVVVVVHRLKNFDEWINLFKADPPPKVGRWRLLREATIETEFTLSGRCSVEVRP